jgi:hypothetical protein
MPLDTGLLYGEMIAAAVLHIAFPFAAVLIVSALPYMALFQKSLVFIGLVVTLSFLSQLGFMTILQVNSCSGINNFSGIFKGAIIGAIITAVMISIPVFIQPMRTMISQYFIKHNTLMTGDAQRRADIVANAAEQLAAVPMKGGGGIIEFEDQTFREMSAGSSYWGAFAGAYGIAFGSLLSATCIGGGESGP